MPRIPPVVVVGGGPVGMVAAGLLGRHGVTAVVVERETAVHPLPRAASLDDEALRVLQALDLIGPTASWVAPMRGMQLVRAPSEPFWHFRDTLEPGPNGWPLANMFHQPGVEQALRDRLARDPLVTVRSGWEVRGLTPARDGARVVVGRTGGGEEETLEAAAVLGCDGARSTVRRLLGVPLRDRGFDQRWMVVDTVADRPLRAPVPQQVCDRSRPATYVPMGGLRYRWEFLLHAGEGEEDLLAERSLADRLAPWTEGVNVRVVRRASYRFHAVRAARWRVGHAFLLGDAAHQMPPFLGQGLCAGIRDAANLTWKLALVRRGLAGDALLDTYERERAPHVDLVTTLAMLVGRVVRARGPAAGALRAGFAVACRLPAAARRPLEEVPAPGLGPGPLVLARQGLPGHRRAGEPFPQPHVRTRAGGDRLLDEVLGDGFALVGLGVDPRERLPAGVWASWDRLGARVVRVAAPGGPPAGDARHADTEDVFDDSGVLADWFHRRRATVAVVRPDRYVMAACEGGRGVPGLAQVTARVAPVLGGPRG